MRFCTFLASSILTCWVFAPAVSAHKATEVFVFRPFDPSDAAVVFAGTVSRSWVSAAEDGGAITTFLFDELRFAKGGKGQDSLQIRLWGGTVGMTRYEIGGTAPERFEIGRRYVVLTDSLPPSDQAMTPVLVSFRVLERVGPDAENYVVMGYSDLSRMGKESGLLTEDEFLARCAPFVRDRP